MGLVVKILLKSNETYGKDLLQPVIDDIEALMSESASDAGRHRGLSMELSLVNKFIELDDSISLNTNNAQVQNQIEQHATEANLLG